MFVKYSPDKVSAFWTYTAIIGAFILDTKHNDIQ